MLHDYGGAGPPILLLHGLMGRARTWVRCLPWLREHGHVWALDAAGHGDAPARGPWHTERFVADAAAAVERIDAGPVAVLGHSMGGLHAWCLAGTRPELVRALVVEDMAPDFRGRTAVGWMAQLEQWPVPFTDPEEVLAFFGPVAGRYFLESFDHRSDGWHLHGELAHWFAIAEHWGSRDHWAQWQAVRAPSLLLEAEHSFTPPGQMAQMAEVAAAPCTHLVVAGAGHLVHDDAPQAYQAAVEGLLRSLPAG
ncbi:alpha/beta hydrolase [Rhodococcus sp. X156]|uniref:alpha/beta fold hydrolase n=1 Tax=Rhodococcus sp. X156 TaxID=2499145 RepID=UPI000FD6D197|nr:alpha/beta hydrolase [Rhodococcus sp. X156]